MNLHTDFAPAQRNSHEEILDIACAIQQNPMIAVFDALPIPLLMINKCRQIVFCNEIFRSLASGNETEEHLGKRPGEAMGCIHAHTNEAGCGTSIFCRDCGAATAILKSLEGSAHTEECRILRNTAEHKEAFDLQVFTSPFLLSDRKLILFTVLDISHEKRKKNLEHIFFHDILNLATGIKYSSQILCKSATSERVRRQCTKMEHAISQMTSEIQDQRDFVKAEQGTLKTFSTPISSTETLRKIWSIYTTHPMCAGRQINISEQSEDFYFKTDPTLLSRILGNMVKNALEASSQGETITIGSRKRDGEVHFWGHNSYIIPDKIQRQIFKRSFSTKGEGRGLGTYSMKLLVEKYLGGRISFESGSDTGTIFTVSLPEKNGNPNKGDDHDRND